MAVSRICFEGMNRKLKQVELGGDAWRLHRIRLSAERLDYPGVKAGKEPTDELGKLTALCSPGLVAAEPVQVLYQRFFAVIAAIPWCWPFHRLKEHRSMSLVAAERSLPSRAPPPQTIHTNTISVVAAFSSQPRVGSAVTDEMSLMEIWRPRVLGDLISIFDGSQVCWLIFWCGAGL